MYYSFDTLKVDIHLIIETDDLFEFIQLAFVNIFCFLNCRNFYQSCFLQGVDK